MAPTTADADAATAAAAGAPPAPRNTSSSLRRALAVLDFVAEFTADPRGPRLGDLADGLDLPKSTVLRLAAPLRETRLVDVDADSGRYRLGPATARLGHIFLERLDLRAVARDVLAGLVSASGETVHLVVPDGHEVVYVDKIESPSTVRMHSRIGARQAAHCTGVGKAYLAYAPPDVVRAVVDAGLARRTPRTLTSARALQAELREIRRRGYAVDDMENEPDLRCVAAPVFDHAGTAVGAVSISGPATRVTLRRTRDLGSLAREAAREVSARIGAPLDDATPGGRA